MTTQLRPRLNKSMERIAIDCINLMKDSGHGIEKFVSNVITTCAYCSAQGTLSTGTGALRGTLTVTMIFPNPITFFNQGQGEGSGQKSKRVTFIRFFRPVTFRTQPKMFKPGPEGMVGIAIEPFELDGAFFGTLV